MKQHNKILHFLTFISVLFVSCQKDNIFELEPNILFSVDLDSHYFDSDNFESYIAAYTSDGKLINYGSLNDSTNWVLEADYMKDVIDIVYFEISNKNHMRINHFRNVNIPQSFTDPNKWEPNPFTNQTKSITIKVEDFGNHDENATDPRSYEDWSYKHNRGYAYPYGNLTWDEVKDGYTYKSTHIHLDPKNQGFELTIFERSTNKPYTCYIDIPVTNINPGDTITLHKSDFTLGELKTILVNSFQYNDFDNIKLATYNLQNERDELITSFDHVVPRSSNKTSIRYLNSNDILPIDYWDFRYMATSAISATSYRHRSHYRILSNKVMPSFIDVKELTGFAITKSGNQFDFTHGDIFPDKNIARSNIRFSKNNNVSSFSYSLHFEGSESFGNTKIRHFDIPEEILNKYIGFKELNSLEWEADLYHRTYTNIPKNSPVEFLRNLLIRKENNSSNQEYYYETFSIWF